MITERIFDKVQLLFEKDYQDLFPGTVMEVTRQDNEIVVHTSFDYFLIDYSGLPAGLYPDFVDDVFDRVRDIKDQAKEDYYEDLSEEEQEGCPLEDWVSDTLAHFFHPICDITYTIEVNEPDYIDRKDEVALVYVWIEGKLINGMNTSRVYNTSRGKMMAEFKLQSLDDLDKRVGEVVLSWQEAVEVS